MKRLLVCALFAVLAVGCGNLDSKPGTSTSGSAGEPFNPFGTADPSDREDMDDTLSDPRPSNNISFNNAAPTNNNPTGNNQSTGVNTFTPDFVPTDSSGAFETLEFELPDGLGVLGVVTISADADTCSALPQTCSGGLTGQGYGLAIQFLSGSLDLGGRYVLGDFDEETATPETRVFEARMVPFNDAIDGPSYTVERGSISLETGGDMIFGEFSLTFEGQEFSGFIEAERCAALATAFEC